MTPTLYGRWQTRFLLLSTVGLATSILFGLDFADMRTPLALLGYVLVLGFGWDVLYNFLQRWRWERDWPPPFQVGAGFVEGALLWGLVNATFIWRWLGIMQLPGVDGEALSLGMFVGHYGIVWLTTFLAAQGPLRVLFPRWRFRGGEWI